MPAGEPRFDYLRGLTAFESFADAELDGLAGVLRERRVSPQKPLFAHGEEGAACYFVVQGRLRLFIERKGKPHVIAQLGPGHLVGHVDFLESSPRGASCAAADSVRLFELTRAAFDALVASKSALAHKLVDFITTLLVNQMRSANGSLSALATTEQNASRPRSPDSPEVQASFKDVARHAGAVRLDFDPFRL